MAPNQKYIVGDCRELLKELPSDSIDCVVTSPPYWGLRDYKTEPLIWGGAPDCEHEWVEHIRKPQGGRGSKTANVGANKNDEANLRDHDTITNFCSKCGAWRGQLGLEPDPNLYIKHLTDIFDEVKRVLKPSGTCWVNLGDTYAGSGGAGGDYNPGGLREGQPKFKQGDIIDVPDKCLVQIPSRFALEMTSRGWILRNEIIWHKPNCMPSSVTDRFTVDFEKVFFFVKSKRYYFKQQMEDAVTDHNPGRGMTDTRLTHGFMSGGNKGIMALKKKYIEEGLPTERNKRTVWTISPKPYSGSHFAVFPIDLIAPMIDAGCPKEICPKCGHIREPIIEKVGEKEVRWSPGTHEKMIEANGEHGSTSVINTGKIAIKGVQGWTDCGCNAGWEPGTVLDIFSGSGTVLEYARKNGLNGIGFDVNPNYKALAEERAMLNIKHITSYEGKPEDVD